MGTFAAGTDSFWSCQSAQSKRGQMHLKGWVGHRPTAVVHAALHKTNLMLNVTGPFWRCQIPGVMLMTYMQLAAKLPKLPRLHHAATLGNTMPRQMSSIQGKHTYEARQSWHSAWFRAKAQPHNS